MTSSGGVGRRARLLPRHAELRRRGADGVDILGAIVRTGLISMPPRRKKRPVTRSAWHWQRSWIARRCARRHSRESQSRGGRDDVQQAARSIGAPWYSMRSEPQSGRPSPGSVRAGASRCVRRRRRPNSSQTRRAEVGRVGLVQVLRRQVAHVLVVDKPTTGRGPRRAEGHARRRAAARPCRRAASRAQRRAEDAADADGDRLDDSRRRGETLEVEGVEVELERLGLDDVRRRARDRELQRLAARTSSR